MAELIWRPIIEAPFLTPVLIYDPSERNDGNGLAIAEQDEDGIWIGCDEFSNYVRYRPSHWARVEPPEK